MIMTMLEARSRARILTGAILLLAFCAAPGLATPKLDFLIPQAPGGSISWGGGTDPLVGTAIGVQEVQGIGTRLHDLVKGGCVGCTLSFVSGPYVGLTTLPNGWIFSSGGEITITGGLDFNNDGDASDPDEVPLNSVLLEGAFVGNPFVAVINGELRLLGAGFVDTKHPALAAFYGYTETGWSGGINLSFDATALPPAAFASLAVASGDVVNYWVPEPATLGLMGFGLLALALRRRLLH